MGNYFTSSKDNIIDYNDTETLKKYMKSHNEKLKELVDKNHTCITVSHTIPPSLEWCGCDDKCVENDAIKLRKLGHKCVCYNNGNIKFCKKNPCIVDRYHMIQKSTHPCATYDKETMIVTTCNHDPCFNVLANYCVIFNDQKN